MKATRFVLVYAAAALLLGGALLKEEPEESALAPLPAEAGLSVVGAQRDFCGSDFLMQSLASQTFRWVYRSTQRAPLWSHGLTVLCEEANGGLVRIGVLADGKPVFQTTYQRQGGFDGDNLSARVVARLLSVEPAVVEAAIAAHLANQKELARLAADLWRARRYRQAADHLWLALENPWAAESQAELHYGLADSYGQLGLPRQAFWHALCYLKLSQKEPSAAWIKRLRGVAGLLAEQPQNATPAAEGLVRAWRQAAAARQWPQALSALQRLCQEAPWAADYQEALANAYETLGWRSLARLWRERAAATRALAADEALQARLMALTR